MTSLTDTSPSAELAFRATDVELDDKAIIVRLADGRLMRAPLALFLRLANATPIQRGRWQLTGRGTGIHWPLLDEDVSVFSLAHPEHTLLARADAGAAPPRRTGRRAS